MNEGTTEAAVEAAEQIAPDTFWQVLLSEWFKPETVGAKVGSVVVILLITAVVYWLLMGAFRRIRRRLDEAATAATGVVQARQQRAATAVGLIASITRWVIIFVAGIWILGALGVDLIPLLAGVGFLGAAVAFGSQSLVRDLVSGLFLLLEGQYAVGDYVNLSGRFGRVEQIGLRTTVLRDLDNQVHHIPNGTITAVTVYEEPYVNYIIEIPLAKADEARRVRAGLDELSAEVCEKYPLHITEMGPAVVAPTDKYFHLVRLPLAVFPTQDWIANEEIMARIKLLLSDLQVNVPEGLQVRCYADIREISGMGRVREV